MRQVICDDSNLERWKAERRKRITASEINIVLGTAPSFYSDTKAEVIARKLDGTEKLFDERSQRRVAHGREREANALRMAGKMLGFPTVPYHNFISHDRWPYLGATLDGLLIPEMWGEPDLTLTSNKPHANDVISKLRAIRGPVLVEIKNTDGGHRYKEKQGPFAGQRAWIDFQPPYHSEQIQTQMAMAEVRWCLLVGSLGADDLIPYLVPFKEGWQTVLDEVNKEAFELLGEIQ